MLCLHLQIFLGCFRELRLLEVLIKLLEAGVIALRGRVMNKPAVLPVLSIRRFDVLLRGVVGVGAGVLVVSTINIVVRVRVPHVGCAFVSQLLRLVAVLIARIVYYGLVT